MQRTSSPHSFIIRFREFNDDGSSDKTLATSPIPEPTTLLLLSIGIAGLAGVGARRRRKKKAVDKS